MSDPQSIDALLVVELHFLADPGNAPNPIKFLGQIVQAYDGSIWPNWDVSQFWVLQTASTN